MNVLYIRKVPFTDLDVMRSMVEHGTFRLVD